MKTRFFKAIMLPMATVVLGIAGAFTTTSMGSNKAFADQRGYYELDDEDACQQSIMCQNVENPIICSTTVLGTPHILKGKVASTDFTCPVTLWQKP